MAGRKAETQYDSKKITDSIKGLKDFYTGMLALALFEAIRGVAEASHEHFFPQFWFFLFAFCTTLLPFYHGNVRYFDDNYLNKAPNSALLFMLDFLLLSIVGALLVWTGAIFGEKFNGDYFIKLYACLLVMDIVWGFVARLHEESWSNIKRWILLNVGTLAAVGLFWGLSRTYQLSNAQRVFIFLFITVVRSILDYWLNWGFYFPEEKEVVAPRTEPGAAGATS